MAAGDPYGVPTGVVPRTSGFVRVVPMREMVPRPAVPVDPIAQAVDDWLLMEHKARAWDDLVRFSKQANSTADAIAARLFDLATARVHPAPDSSTR